MFPSHVRLDVVTCIYEKEVGMLELQARSFAKFMDDRVINNIYVIVNEVSPEMLRLKIIQRIKPLYERFGEKLIVINASELMHIRDGDSGWVTQQVLKLKIASLVKTKCYLLLDAKNHLVRRLTINDLFSKQFKPKSFWQPVGAAWDYRRKFLSEMMDLQDLNLKEKTLPVITPYIVYKDIAVRAVSFLENKTGQKIEVFFTESPHSISEFLLYFYFLKKECEILDLYEMASPLGIVIWESSIESVEQRVAQALQGQCFFFAVHSKALVLLSDEAFDEIASLWRKLGFFDEKTPSTVFRQFLTEYN